MMMTSFSFVTGVYDKWWLMRNLNNFMSIYMIKNKIQYVLRNIEEVNDWDVYFCRKTEDKHLHVNILMGHVSSSFVVGTYQQYKFFMDCVKDMLQNKEDNSSCSSTV